MLYIEPFLKRNFIIKELAIIRRNLNEIKHLKFVDQIILANPIFEDLGFQKFKIPKVVLEKIL